MKKREPTPDVYKIIYRPGRWKSKCERFYTAFDAQQALLCFHYAFEHGHVTSNMARIYSINRYDRFANKWYDESHTVDKLPDTVWYDKKNHIVLTR